MTLWMDAAWGIVGAAALVIGMDDACCPSWSMGTMIVTSVLVVFNVATISCYTNPERITW